MSFFSPGRDRSSAALPAALSNPYWIEGTASRRDFPFSGRGSLSFQLTQPLPTPQVSQQKIGAAGDRAWNALACGELYRLDVEFIPDEPSPGTLLNRMLGRLPSTIVFTIIVDHIPSPPGSETSIHATTTAGRLSPVQLSNGGQQDRPGLLQVVISDVALNGNAQELALTLLHELGHAYHLIYGERSTQIRSDGGSHGLSVANSNLVRKNCKP